MHRFKEWSFLLQNILSKMCFLHKMKYDIETKYIFLSSDLNVLFFFTWKCVFFFPDDTTLSQRPLLLFDATESNTLSLTIWFLYCCILSVVSLKPQHFGCSQERDFDYFTCCFRFIVAWPLAARKPRGRHKLWWKVSKHPRVSTTKGIFKICLGPALQFS